MAVTKQQALDYHFGARPGKIEVSPTKPCRTQRDLSLAYTPGVAEPCLEIQKNPQDAFKYTAKGNLVAVISNGTAVLGLGDIGALAGKPVMEGKGVLFKRFADIDVFESNSIPTIPTKSSRSASSGADLRRHQPRRHQGPRVFLHRRDAQGDDENSRLPRRSARHRHHLRRGPGQRPGSRGQKDRRSQSGLQWRREPRRIACAEHYVRLGVGAKTSLCATPKAWSTRAAPTA